MTVVFLVSIIVSGTDVTVVDGMEHINMIRSLIVGLVVLLAELTVVLLVHGGNFKLHSF